MTILVAMDLSGRAEPVLRAGMALAAPLGEPVVAMHAISAEALEKMREEMPADGRYDDVIFDRLEQDLQALVARVQPAGEVDVDVRIVRGEAPQVIVDRTAEDDCRYAVIGIRNRSRVGKLLFGSTAQQVLLGAQCPVVAVPV